MPMQSGYSLSADLQVFVLVVVFLQAVQQSMHDATRTPDASLSTMHLSVLD